MNLISASGFRAAIAARIAATCRSVAVVWQTIPSRAMDRLRHLIGRLDHVEMVQVFDDSLDLDVPAPADHQDMVALALERAGRLMDPRHQRTGRVDEPLAGGLQPVRAP